MKKISVKFHNFNPDPPPEKCETYKKKVQTWTNKEKNISPFTNPQKLDDIRDYTLISYIRICGMG